MEIEIEQVVADAAPELEVLCVEACGLTNASTPDSLWSEIENAASALRDSYELQDINKRSAISATRAAYKRLGKEPNRYRPSAEALCRRIVKGGELYRTLSLIDLINLVSVLTGHSIGGFDMDKIEGGRLRLGRGDAGEPFEAIGRGPLNIEGLPVYRDEVGPIGTPTSDNERTKLTDTTSRLLMCVNMYAKDDVEELKELISRLLSTYCGAREIGFKHFFASK